LASRLPALPARWAWARGPLVAAGIVCALALTANTWIGAVPHARRAPLQIGLMAAAWLAIAVSGKLGVPRWSFAAFAAAVAAVCAIAGAYFFALIASIGTLIFIAGRVAGWIATVGGSPRDGDIATAIIVGYSFGQLMPAPY